eukprot:3767792-Rhodomonas_salina.1
MERARCSRPHNSSPPTPELHGHEHEHGHGGEEECKVCTSDAPPERATATTAQVPSPPPDLTHALVGSLLRVTQAPTHALTLTRSRSLSTHSLALARTQSHISASVARALCCSLPPPSRSSLHASARAVLAVDRVLA